MLTKWFESRTSRAREDRSFRPWLEFLEERNAPSGPGDPPGPGPNGPPHPGPDHPPHHHPPGVPLGVDNSISVGINAHGSFNGSTITGSFNTTINNTTVTVNLTMGQTTGLAGLLGIGNVLSSALSNPQLGDLLSDEIALAVDNYLTSPAISSSLGLSSSVVNALQSDEATLTSAIAANPLESSAIGSLFGSLAYGLTQNALNSAQATI